MVPVALRVASRMNESIMNIHELILGNRRRTDVELVHMSTMSLSSYQCIEEKEPLRKTFVAKHAFLTEVRSKVVTTNFISWTDRTDRKLSEPFPEGHYKSYCYGYNPEKKQHSSQWEYSILLRYKSVQVKFSVKSEWVSFINAKGIVYTECVPLGQMTNQIFCL